MAVKTLNFDFNPDLFNNIYWHLLRAVNNFTIRFIWVFGGSSAAKTYSVVQMQIILMLQGSNENAMVMRKVGSDIRDSIFADFKGIINDWNLQDHFIIQENLITCRLTGSFVRFRGLDAAGKIKGIARFKRVILEEVDQFDEVDYKQVRKRLRGMKGQQIFGLFNPISEEHWIKQHVFDTDDWIEYEADVAGYWMNTTGNALILKTNYLDNVFIVGRWEVNNDGHLVQVGGFVDQHTIDDFEKDKLTDFNYYQIYGLGNWGKIRTGGEFWKDFNSNTHLCDIPWNEDLPLHITWDENVNPFLTCLIWQFYGPDNTYHPGKKLAVQIAEICLEDPRNRISHICTDFKQHFPQDRVQGLFVYGDRTSIREDTKLEKGENMFTKIIEHLYLYKPRLRIQSVNPSIVLSAGFINSCYTGNKPLYILINRKCKKSIYDYSYALEDSDGTLKKTKRTNPVTKVSYEEFGHPSDAKRYIITVAFQNEYSLYLRGGNKALPKSGKNASKNSW
jgi:phage terminase large subunit